MYHKKIFVDCSLSLLLDTAVKVFYPEWVLLAAYSSKDFLALKVNLNDLEHFSSIALKHINIQWVSTGS